MYYLEHDFHFFDNKNQLLSIWDNRLLSLKNSRINAVLGVWDRIEGNWFGECPVIIQFTAGNLTVVVKSDRYLALGWNDVDTTKKPVWFDPITDKGIIKDLHWQEDLIWKEYPDFTAENIIGKQIELIEIIGGNKSVTGIRIKTKAKSLIIKDNGDYIIAFCS